MGEEFIPAQFPERIKKEVNTFDVKKFVTDAKKKKAVELQNERRENEDFGMIPDRPNPFAPSNPFSMGSNLGGVDINKMMEDIDKKLKELEDLDQDKEKANVDITPTKEIIEPISKETKLNIDMDSKVFEESNVTDDEYFDDFFD